MDTGQGSFLSKGKNCWPTNSSQMPLLPSKPQTALQLAVPPASGSICVASGELEKLCIASQALLRPQEKTGLAHGTGPKIGSCDVHCSTSGQLAEVRFQRSIPKQRFATGGRKTARAGSFGRSRAGAVQRHRSMGGRLMSFDEVRCRAVLARGGRDRSRSCDSLASVLLRLNAGTSRLACCDDEASREAASRGVCRKSPSLSGGRPTELFDGGSRSCSFDSGSRPEPFSSGTVLLRGRGAAAKHLA